MRSPSPDALDPKLPHALQVDGRAPFSRIAEILGVSDQTVVRRFRKLRNTAGLRIVGHRREPAGSPELDRPPALHSRRGRTTRQHAVGGGR
ncbi:AsnC family protein [Streptomyces canus]|jgi:hypothetical protein|uniref:AsnC family protein n=1 Tax=Streptomyces canus TaxID=58343 RepID=UPI0036ED4368